MDQNILEMNAEAVSEIKGIMGNHLLNVQVLCLVQLVSKGIFLSVELITKNSSKIFGKLYMCTGHSFIVGSEFGIVANIRFTDIETLEISNLRIGA
ncbi:MAG: hypothetical protein WC781_05795 [Candidatus Pacearchaeota archaeon]|jgi:hypothetical protein